MAAPELYIEIDPGPWDEPKFRDHQAAGGRLSGRVRVKSDDMVPCRRLIVRAGWHTDGRGDTDYEHCMERTLFEGELMPGEQEYPFECTLPDGPMSYAGHHINIVWEVQAQLDLAWKRDPAASSKFYLTIS